MSYLSVFILAATCKTLAEPHFERVLNTPPYKIVCLFLSSNINITSQHYLIYQNCGILTVIVEILLTCSPVQI